jgi:hypothetical protein
MNGDSLPQTTGPVMRTFFALAIGLLLTLAPAATSAPAPLQPRDRLAKAEIVFDARTAERVRLALVYLRSTSLLDSLAATPAVARCLPQGSPAERRAWLLGRITLQVGASDHLVTVRVAAGRGEDGLAILHALQRAVTAADRDRGEEVQMARLVRAAQRQRWAIAQGQVLELEGSESDEGSARYQFMVEPLKLARAPRVVR